MSSSVLVSIRWLLASRTAEVVSTDGPDPERSQCGTGNRGSERAYLPRELRPPLAYLNDSAPFLKDGGTEPHTRDCVRGPVFTLPSSRKTPANGVGTRKSAVLRSGL